MEKVINLIRNISRIFYDDATCVLVDHMCRFRIAEEHKLAEHLQMEHQKIRQCLSKLKFHCILISEPLPKDAVT